MAQSSQTIPPPASAPGPGDTDSGSAERCVVCNSGLPQRPVVEFGRCRLHACPRCGSWTYLPRPNSADQSAIHDTGDYFDHPYFDLRRRLSPSIIRRCRYAFTQLGLAADSLRGQRVLDIGCDTGVFLQAAAQEFGIVPVGVDTASRAIAAAQQQGIEAYCAPIEQAPEHLHDFPAITAIDLIEHVAQPGDVLRAIRRRLRPGGALYLETPNIRSMVYQFGRALSHAVQPQQLLERLFPPQHVQYFTESSLAALCRSAGFEVVSIGRRALPWEDIATSFAVRAALAPLQLADRIFGTEILICAVLKRPLQDA
ncbi:MAG TPA: class I SAM-dependent methyltransferase [Bryobacteraceae bacterium]|nr:class I SAM-dependent methyltransferase [Bryobacteraceae bacterium]